MDDESKYIYPVEEIDEIIEKIQSGIEPMITDRMKIEIKLRLKELKSEVFGDDSDDDDDSDVVAKHQEMMKAHIEAKRRTASRDDVLIITLSEEQKQAIREDMAVSIVKPDPNNPYNLSNDEMFTSEERRKIESRLANLKNCYYNQIDYVNAMGIIRDAIKYSLEHDWPWMSYEEACEAFNKGDIKFTYCNIPKLYINLQTQITDPDILKGVVNGNVTLRDRDDEDADTKKTVRKDQKGVRCQYNIIGSEDYQHFAELHNRGYDTPISTGIRTKSKIYNRFTIPTSNVFSPYNSFGTCGDPNKDPTVIQLHDWSREDAGVRYYNQQHNIRQNVSTLVKDINKSNDGMLNQVLGTNASEFLISMKYSSNDKDTRGFDNYYCLNSDDVESQKTIAIEQNILNNIRNNNPNI